VPSNKQRRQAAQRRLQRQLERRAELARKRRRNAIVVATVLAVLVVAGGVALATGIGGGGKSDTAAAASSTTASGGNGAPCAYTPDGTSETTVAPPASDVPTSGTVGLTMTTADGPIGLTLDQAAAPCAAASFVNLAKQHFFDNTPCHRETDSAGLKVLQCGDPTGSGTGGPGYQYPTHTTGSETYTRGTLAMANSGQGFDGSQFFLVYGDSQLQPDYTVVGSIDAAGLAVLDTIAARGNDGSNGQGDGKPKPPGVTIQKMTVQEAATSAPATDSAAPTGTSPTDSAAPTSAPAESSTAAPSS
jgi:peptidyl-prolyl cis-trans isomerase B (cyclophilin B)